jgi:hypothetical protein
MLSGCAEMIQEMAKSAADRCSSPELDYKLPRRSWHATARTRDTVVLKDGKTSAVVTIWFAQTGDLAPEADAGDLAAAFAQHGYVVSDIRDESPTGEYEWDVIYYQASFRMLELASPHRLGKASVRMMGWTSRTKVAMVGVWPAENDAAAVVDFDALRDRLSYECD